MRPVSDRRPITLLLDGVCDDDDLGAIFRLCEAFLIQRLVIAGKPANLRSRKLVRAAAGAQRSVPWTAAEDAFEVVRAAKDYGLWIIAAEKTAASLSIVSMPVEFPALLVLGSEKAGINHQIANWADTLVTVPGATRKLGIVSAGAILLYELNRKLAE